MRPLIRLAAATALVAAAGLTFPGTAQASTCSSDTGVSVVVDFSKIGGGVATTCVEGGGGDTAAQLLEVDHDLTRDQQYPGVVCKIDGAPGDAECGSMPPANAYWGLFWSDGSGGWTYSSQGVDNLNVPAGGSVGMAWQDGGSQDQPGAAPPQHSSGQSSSPSPSPQSGGGGHHSSSGGGGGGGTSGTSTPPSSAPSASASGSAAPGPGSAPSSKGAHHTGDDSKASGHHRKHDQASATSSPSASSSPSDDPSAAVPRSDPAATSDDGSLPVWVAPAVIGALLALAGVIALVRRRRAA